MSVFFFNQEAKLKCLEDICNVYSFSHTETQCLANPPTATFKVCVNATDRQAAVKTPESVSKSNPRVS